MPASDPSHTASSDPRKEELASLFRQWDRAGAGAGKPRAALAIGLRAGATLLLLVAALMVMRATHASVAFWAQSSTPRDLGDLRAAWVEKAGPRPIDPALQNAFVAARGLVPTRLVAVKDERDPGGEGAMSWLFYCPLEGVVVLTQQPISIDPSKAGAADARLAPLVASRLALPEETAVSVSVAGRLLPADEAPSELRPFVTSFARRVERAPGDLWVLLDGARPADATWAVVVWALAAAAPLVSLIFLVQAIRRTRRATSMEPRA